jgi:aldehyde:ferredoxin oxidoreductase
MPAGGYFGRALVVDVTSGTSQHRPLPDSVLRGYIGGSGLGTWLLWQLGTPGADPLGPRAPLAFVFSPLVGTPLTTSAKFAVVAKSPLTDALASSQFAIAGKRRSGRPANAASAPPRSPTTGGTPAGAGSAR